MNKVSVGRDLAGRLHERVCKCIIAHLDSHPLPFAGMLGHRLRFLLCTGASVVCFVPHCFCIGLENDTKCQLGGTSLAGCTNACASFAHFDSHPFAGTWPCVQFSALQFVVCSTLLACLNMGQAVRARSVVAGSADSTGQ
jgi:hypothetical protein